MTVTPTRRERLRTATVAEIKDLARRLLKAGGPQSISLRAIARDMGMTAPAIYRYFPSLDQLVPACTSENAVRMRPPGVTVLEGLTRPDERIGRFVQELFAYYGRSAPWTPRAGVDRHELPILDIILSRREAGLKALVEETLGPLRRRRHALHAALALTDFGVWRSLTRSGLSTEAAARLVTEVVVTWLKRRSSTR